MSWTKAVDDLRTLISDNSFDKYRYRQPLFPNPGKNNTHFKTFDFKRVTNFAVMPNNPFIGVFKNGVRIEHTKFIYDDLNSGEFQLTEAPQDGDILEATFYIQWFLNEDLESFLRSASVWLGFSEDWTQMPLGLQPSAKQFAASEAYQKLATRFSERLSSMYRVQDQKDPETEETIKSFFDLATKFREHAKELRNNYYERQGQPLAPLHSSIPGRVDSEQTKF